MRVSMHQYVVTKKILAQPIELDVWTMKNCLKLYSLERAGMFIFCGV